MQDQRTVRCACGCGKPTALAAKTSTARGVVKGQPLRFISGHNTIVRQPESAEQRADRFWAKVDRRGDDECWPWMAGRFPGGYGQFKSNGRTYVASRLAVELATGQPVPSDLFACHRCDNPPCCNPAHLFVSDAQGNNADMIDKGRAKPPARGEGSGRKLTWAEVEQIRIRYALGGISQKRLGAEYGVGQMTVSRAVRGVSW